MKTGGDEVLRRTPYRISQDIAIKTRRRRISVNRYRTLSRRLLSHVTRLHHLVLGVLLLPNVCVAKSARVKSRAFATSDTIFDDTDTLPRLSVLFLLLLILGSLPDTRILWLVVLLLLLPNVRVAKSARVKSAAFATSDTIFGDTDTLPRLNVPFLLLPLPRSHLSNARILLLTVLLLLPNMRATEATGVMGVTLAARVAIAGGSHTLMRFDCLALLLLGCLRMVRILWHCLRWLLLLCNVCATESTRLMRLAFAACQAIASDAHTLMRYTFSLHFLFGCFLQCCCCRRLV